MDLHALTLRERFVRLYGRVAPSGRGTFKLARFARRSRDPSNRKGRFAVDAGLLDLDLDVYPDVAMAYGVYEIETIRTIRSLLRPGDRVIDVGANIGYVTLIASRRVGSAGRVDAIEPEPHNRARLAGHIELNTASNVAIHAVAASDRAGVATIHLPQSDRYNHGTSSLFAVPDRTIPTEVPTARLDELIDGPVPRLVKIDVEGAEPLAIAGMTRLLDVADPPAIVIEHNAETAGRAGFAPDEWLRRLLAIQPRYQVSRIGWRLRRLTDPLRELNSILEANLLLRAPASSRAGERGRAGRHDEQHDRARG